MFEWAKQFLSAAWPSVRRELSADAEAQLRFTIQKSLEAKLDDIVKNKVEEALEKASKEELSAQSRKLQEKIKLGKRVEIGISVLSVLLGIFGIFVFWMLPDKEKIKEGVGYLAYLFPLYAALVAGRGVVQTTKDVDLEEQASRAFADSALFVLAGGIAQVAYQLGKNPCAVLVCAAVILVLLIASLIWHGFAEYKRREARGKLPPKDRNKAVAELKALRPAVFLQLFVVGLALAGTGWLAGPRIWQQAVAIYHAGMPVCFKQSAADEACGPAPKNEPTHTPPVTTAYWLMYPRHPRYPFTYRKEQ